jgi:DNA-3-methyladenine glycosylase I
VRNSLLPGWDVKPPKNDQEYFDRMSKAIFTAGLNWKMVENKWANFHRAFADFSPEKVAKLTEKDVKALMSDTGIVRNEKKIRATIMNAQSILALEKEFGSVREYLDSFGKKEDALQKDLQERFKHVGPSTARTFLWSVGHPLTPTKEEKAWMKGHHEH